MCVVTAGVAGVCCYRSGKALLDSVCVTSVALVGSIHLISVDENIVREAQRGHWCFSEETDGVHAALSQSLCYCADSNGFVLLR